jgi:hypothetical protein
MADEQEVAPRTHQTEDELPETGEDVFAGDEGHATAIEPLRGAAVGEAPTQIPGTSKEEAEAALEEINSLMDDNRRKLSPIAMKALDEGRRFLEGLSDIA